MASCGSTILVASHDLEAIENILDNVIFINKGKIISEGGYSEFLYTFSHGIKAHIKTRSTPNLSASLITKYLISINDNIITVILKNSDNITSELQHVQELLISEGVIIEDLQIESPSLRDAFINIVENGAHNV